jgi:hypothetical protein
MKATMKEDDNEGDIEGDDEGDEEADEAGEEEGEAEIDNEVALLPKIMLTCEPAPDTWPYHECGLECAREEKRMPMSRRPRRTHRWMPPRTPPRTPPTDAPTDAPVEVVQSPEPMIEVD